MSIRYSPAPIGDSAALANGPVAAMDPGISELGTVAAVLGDGEVGDAHIGAEATARMKQLLRARDRAAARVAALERDAAAAQQPTAAETAARLERARECMRKQDVRIRDLVDGVHQSVLGLVRGFSVFFLPRFNVSGVNRVGGGLQRMTKRVGAALRHGQLVQRLESAALASGTVIRWCSEAHTTCTCPCGRVRATRDLRRVQTCNACGLTVQRDVSAAFSILVGAMHANGVFGALGADDARVAAAAVTTTPRRTIVEVASAGAARPQSAAARAGGARR